MIVIDAVVAAAIALTFALVLGAEIAGAAIGAHAAVVAPTVIVAQSALAALGAEVLLGTFGTVGAVAAGGAPAIAGDMLAALLTVPTVGLAAGQADIQCELIHGVVAYVLLRLEALAALHAVALALGALYALLTGFAVEIFVIIIAPVAPVAHKALTGTVGTGVRGVFHLALGRAAQKEAIPTLDAVTVQFGCAALAQSALGAVYVLRQAELAVLAAVLVAVNAVKAGAAAVTEEGVAVVQNTAVAIGTGVIFQPTVCLGTVFAARAADAAHIVVPMVVTAGGTLGAVLIGGVDMKLHARQ